MAKLTKAQARRKKQLRIRKKVSGTESTPRLSVFKSNKGFYAQLINDETGKTILSSSTKVLKLTGNNVENAVKVGTDLGEKIRKAGVKSLVFDRSGYIYHGKVKAFADAVRETGIEF